MSCCGRKRAELATTAQATASAPRIGGATAMQYAGHTSLSVRGPVTGRIYHFAASGAVLAIDPRDAPSLAAIPQLRPANLPRQ